MTREQALLTYTLRLADNALIIGQRMVERVTTEAELEEELANANFALDYIGQARMLYTYAGELEGEGRTEDDFAYLRDSQEFRNLVILEQPNGHFGDAIVRQCLYETFYLRQLEALANCSDERLAALAVRAEKEIRYHLRHARQWLVRLGDGTEESHRRVTGSLERYWRFTGEFFAGDAVDERIRADFNGPDLQAIRAQWLTDVTSIIESAGLQVPEAAPIAMNGRAGLHSEHLGYLVAEMQHLHRACPGVKW